MSALFIWISRRLALTWIEPPDLSLVTCATSWVATWFTGSLVLSHNVLRDNCCNWTTTTTSVSFGLFRFSAFSVHSVSSVHGAQVHRCWSRTLHTTLVLWKQTDFQPPCSLRNLQRKFQFLQKQSTLLSIAKNCLPTSFQKGVSWDHIQRNSYHYCTTRFMVIFVLPTLNSRSTTPLTGRSLSPAPFKLGDGPGYSKLTV